MDFIFKVILVATAWTSQAAVLSPPRQARLSMAETQPSYYFTDIDGYPGTYSFGYDVKDQEKGNQFRTEERYPNGTVVGSYGYVDNKGKLYRYRYVADEKGYRVRRIKSNKPLSRPQNTKPAPVQNDLGTNAQLQASSVTWSRKKNPTKNWTLGKGMEKPVYQQDYIINRPGYYQYS